MKRVTERGHKFERMYRKTTLQVDDMKQRLNKRRAATDERKYAG